MNSQQYNDLKARLEAIEARIAALEARPVPEPAQSQKTLTLKKPNAQAE